MTPEEKQARLLKFITEALIRSNSEELEWIAELKASWKREEIMNKILITMARMRKITERDFKD